MSEVEGLSDTTFHQANWGSWRQLQGSVPILFSAPHEVAQIRNSNMKVAEPGTGDLAFLLADKVGGSAIATADVQAGDPNWDIGHPYRDVIRELLPSPQGIVIDLHMMKDRGFMACIGCGNYPDLVDGIWQELATEFTREFISLSVGWPFNGGRKTITTDLQISGYRAFQLEMRSDCYDTSSETYPKVEHALLAFVEKLKTNGSLL